MQTLTINDLKVRGSKALPKNNVSYLIVNSKPKAAILPVSEYELLLEAVEELQDLKDMEASKNEDTISESEFDTALGLD